MKAMQGGLDGTKNDLMGILNGVAIIAAVSSASPSSNLDLAGMIVAEKATHKLLLAKMMEVFVYSDPDDANHRRMDATPANALLVRSVVKVKALEFAIKVRDSAANKEPKRGAEMGGDGRVVRKAKI